MYVANTCDASTKYRSATRKETLLCFVDQLLFVDDRFRTGRVHAAGDVLPVHASQSGGRPRHLLCLVPGCRPAAHSTGQGNIKLLSSELAGTFHNSPSLPMRRSPGTRRDILTCLQYITQTNICRKVSPVEIPGE